MIFDVSKSTKFKSEQNSAKQATVTEVPFLRYFKFLLGFDLRQDLQRNLSLIINHSGAWIGGLLNFCQESHLKEQCCSNVQQHFHSVPCTACESIPPTLDRFCTRPGTKQLETWLQVCSVLLEINTCCFQVSSLAGNVVTNFRFLPLSKLVIASSLKWFQFIG